METPPPVPTVKSYMVGVDFLVVPDGLTPDGRLRLNVSLSPSLRAELEPSVDIRTWPQGVAKVAAGLKACLSDVLIDPSSTDEDKRTVTLRKVGVELLSETLSHRSEAVSLWQRLFALGDPSDPRAIDDGFAWLLQVIQKRSVGPEPDSNAQVRSGTYQSESIGQIYGGLHTNIAGANLARAALRQSYLEVNEALPRHLRLGEPELSAEWWLELHRQWFDEATLNDPVSRLLAKARGKPHGIAQQVHQEMVAAWAQHDKWSSAAARGAAARGNLTDAFANLGVEFRPDGIAATSGGDHAPHIKLEIARLKASWGLDLLPIDPSNPAGKYKITPAEDAGRKLAGIMSYPTLSKFLGLHGDFTMAPGALGGTSASYGAISVYMGDAPQQSPSNTLAGFSWTAFVRRLRQTAASDYFGPCGRAESMTQVVDPGQPIIDGIFNLNAPEIGGSNNRFILDTADPATSTLAIGERSKQIAKAARMGSKIAQRETSLPDTATPGIRLIDRSADASAQQVEARNAEIVAKIARGAVVVRDSEDLLQGLRIDIALAEKDGGQPAADRWRSLTSRILTFPNEHDIPATFLQSSSIAGYRSRDDGEIRPMTAVHTGRSTEGALVVTTVAYQQILFTWAGESLAVKGRLDPAKPGNLGEADVTHILSPQQDLAVDINFDLPNSGPGRPSVLREQRAYLFGARARFANGCGRTVEETVARYSAVPGTAPNLTLGSGGGAPFLYERTSAVLAPDVLLPWTSQIVQEKESKWLGETVDHLVIRTRVDSWFSTLSTHRYLVPSRSKFEISEQAGTFDATNVITGGLTGEGGLEMDPLSGSLPIASDGRWHFPPATAPASGALPPPPTQASRGMVAVLRSNTVSPWKPYFIDPACREMRACFVPAGDPPTDYGLMRQTPSFWNADEGPNETVPIILELKPKTKRQAPWAVFDERDNSDDVATYDTGDTVTLRKVTVSLEVGESVDLMIWTSISADNVRSHRFLRTGTEAFRQGVSHLHAALSGLAHPGEDRAGGTLALSEAASWRVSEALIRRVSMLKSNKAKQVDKAVATLLATTPVAPVVRMRKVHLVHAVDKPLRTPTFATAANGEAWIHAVVVSGSAVEKAGPALVNWSAYVHGAQCLKIDQMAWPSQEGGATAFFVGHIDLHRASTGKFRCDASWLDFGPDTLTRSPETDVWVMSPVASGGTLFAPDGIEYAGSLRDQPFDLAFADHSGDLRPFFYAFKDGRARHVRLQLIATSRFTKYFPPKPGAYDNAGPALSEASYSIWVPCTFRPPAPDIDHIEPRFTWATHHDKMSRATRFTRTTSLRIYLKPGWWSSGEGEQLGVVCATEREVDDGSASGNVSRWGADPTHISGAVRHGVHWQQLVNAATDSPFAAIVRNVELAVQSPRSPAPFPDGVNTTTACSAAPGAKRPGFSVACYNPVVDADQGLYCDVSLDPGRAYWPFVSLALVRFQPQCVERLRASPSTITWAQIPASRTGTVTPLKHGRVAFEYSGYGYTRANHGSVSDPKGLTQTPLLNLTLVIAGLWSPEGDTSDEYDWQPALDRQGKRIKATHLKPVVAADGELVWKGVIVTPPFHPLQIFGLEFDEIEMTWMDDVSMTQVIGQSIDRPGSLVERLTFHHIVKIER